MASVKRKKKLFSAKEAARMIADSVSDLSDEDFELDTDIESETDAGVRCLDETVRPAATAVPQLFEWEEYPDIDPWEASWLPEFNKRRGILVDTDDFEPIHYFKLFFPDSVFDLMSVETNRYAEQFFDSPTELPTFSRFHKWVPTTATEMKGFVALQIEMGLDWRYRVSEHWSTRSLSRGCFGTVMSRDRYMLLQNFLHFADNGMQPKKGEDNYNPLYKIQPLMDLTLPTYRKVYQPGANLSVDESMIRYKGRLAFRQYMPNKPTKYGIKDFVLAESETGYCLNLMTYTGKDSFLRTRDTPLTTQVVTDLLKGYEHAGHVVYMDNFYSSPDLFQKLQLAGIGACGTVRQNRRNMPEAVRPDKLKLKRGDDPVFYRSGDMVACAWQDVKRVTSLSTVHTNNTCEKTIRERGNPDGRTLDKPVMIEEYNWKMSGVDRLDQMLGSYAYCHKSVKWYQTVYHRIREIALTNGHILHKLDKDKGANCVDGAVFRKQVVNGLLSEYVPVASRPRGRPSMEPVPNRLQERHFPASYEDKKYKPDCEVCSSRDRQNGKKRHQCNTFCKQCQLPMHAVACFERYHTVRDYRK